MFGPQNVLSSSATQINDVYATDLDNDGDEDVLSGMTALLHIVKIWAVVILGR